MLFLSVRVVVVVVKLIPLMPQEGWKERIFSPTAECYGVSAQYCHGNLRYPPNATPPKK